MTMLLSTAVPMQRTPKNGLISLPTAPVATTMDRLAISLTASVEMPTITIKIPLREMQTGATTRFLTAATPRISGGRSRDQNGNTYSRHEQTLTKNMDMVV